MRTIHFPKHTGLNPRPLTNMDQRSIKYYRAVESRNYPKQAEIERELRNTTPFDAGELDIEYSNGKMLDTCTITHK